MLSKYIFNDKEINQGPGKLACLSLSNEGKCRLWTIYKIKMF
jgi:hypothetical protein